MIYMMRGLMFGKNAVRWVAAGLLLFQCAARADVIPGDRITTWQDRVGVEGGIPNVTKIFTNLTAPATLAQINAAIAACPSNQVVQLGPGTYVLNPLYNATDGSTHSIFFNGRNGVVLRGAGPSTILRFVGSPYVANILVQGNSQSVIWDGPSGVVDWTNGYAAGSVNLMVSSTNGLTVGKQVCVDQLNDNDDVNVANSWETTGTGAPGCASAAGCADCSRACGNRAQLQWVTIQSISGNTITVWPPLQMPNWRASQQPQIWWINGMSERCGIENLAIDGTSSSPYSAYGANVAFWNTRNCWVKDVRSTNNPANPGSDSTHVHFQQSSRGEVRHSYFHGTRAGASLSYGTIFNTSSAIRVEDNIFEAIYAPIIFSYGASGNVIGYNYFTNMLDNSTVMAACAWFHAGHSVMNLLEGNYGNQIRGDYFHGSAAYNTIYRNTMTGWEPDNFDSLSAIILTVTNRYWNVVGNVLGKSGFHTVADSLCTGTYVGTAVYQVGWNNNAYSLNNDPVTVSTLYRHGNYDVANNAVMWNSTNADHKLPASLYLPSRPSWFGDRPWPPFDPNTPATAVVTNLPAGYRSVYGIDPPAAGGGVRLPVAIVNSSVQSGAAPLNVTFSSAGSYNAQGVALSYYWSFGDGAVSTTANPAHSYPAGQYRAQLTVSDGVNVGQSRILNILVTNAP